MIYIKNSINFIEYSKKDLSNYTLLEGFPGMGLAGTISAKYLIDKLNFKEHGFIDSDVFIPIVRIHDGKPINPSRIYVNDKLKLVLLISEQIIPKNVINVMAEKVVNWIKEKKIKKVISLAGISVKEPSNEIYGIAANEKSKKELSKFGMKIIKDGITTGITALMLLKLRESKIMAYSILSSVTMGADYKASANIIKKLNEILGLKIEVDPLLKEAKVVEKALLKHLQDMKKADADVTKKIEPHVPMYT